MKKLFNQKEFLKRIAGPQHIKLEGTGDAYVRYIISWCQENQINNIDELRKALMPFFNNDKYEYNKYYDGSGPFIMEALGDLD